MLPKTTEESLFRYCKEYGNSGIFTIFPGEPEARRTGLEIKTNRSLRTGLSTTDARGRKKLMSFRRSEITNYELDC